MKSTQVELSNLDVLASLTGFDTLRNRDIESDVGYRIALNAKRIRKAAEDYQEYRNDLLKRYAQLSEHGEFTLDEKTKELVFKDSEARKEANEALKLLNKATVTLDLYQFPLGLFKNARFPESVWEDLYWMIRLDKEESSKKKEPKVEEETLTSE